MASTSEEQLLKYVDFYMNGLVDPLALNNPYAMMSEAFHYELDDADGAIEQQGVVYSEMLAKLPQSRWAEYNYKRVMWPDSYITYISGGDPLYIPDLTALGTPLGSVQWKRASSRVEAGNSCFLS